jgi:shikimate kinase
MGKLRLASESRALASKRARSSISDHRMSLGLTEHKKEDRQERLARIREALGPRSIVLIGLMGAGKTAVGRRLANRFDLPFIDADSEIEMAAGTSISEIFDEQGEAYFRQGERKVIARLLEGGPQVLATGGGAYMNADTRANIKARGLSVWLRAELRVLLKRVQRRDNRPLLACGDPETVMKKLMTERYPIYEEADVIVESRDVPHDVIVGAVIDALAAKLGCEANAPQEAKARQEAKAHQEQSRKKVQ